MGCPKCGPKCRCVVLAGGGISVTGDGAPDTPYRVTATGVPVGGMPAGGDTPQVLKKSSAADFDATWDEVDHSELTGVGPDDHHARDHHARHEPGGADAMAVDAAANVGSLRTLGSGATQAAAGDDARFGAGGPPSGAAGGVLGGTYPNPAFAVDMATQAELDAEASIRATVDTNEASTRATQDGLLVPKSLFDAFTILAADVDNTPAALTVAASTVLGRKAAGGIVAMTVAELRTLLGDDIQVFATPGSFSWSKPAGCDLVTAFVIGGGGGAGSGRKGAAGTVRSAGAGGGSAGYSQATFKASDLANTVGVTVGTGGTGGAAQATNSTNGVNGSDGTASYFGDTSATALCRAEQGFGGNGGSATTTTGGSAGTGMFSGAAGRNTGATGTVGLAGNAGAMTAGGACGGGITTGDAASNGGAGAVPNARIGTTGATAGSGGGAGGNGVNPGANSPCGGGSGAGGASSTSTNAGAGGNGGYGSGGGGGGAAVDSVGNSGKGGDGGGGLVVVVSR